jgi:hypothetical protein
MMDPSSDKESAAARTALLELLNKNGRTWHDLQKIMAEIEMQRMAAEKPLRRRQGRRVGRKDRTATIWESRATTSWV